MAPGSRSRPGLGTWLKVPNCHTSTPHFRKPIWGAGMQKGSPNPLAEGAQRWLRRYTQGHTAGPYECSTPGILVLVQVQGQDQRHGRRPGSKSMSNVQSNVQVQCPCPILGLGQGLKSRSKVNVPGYRSTPKFRTNPCPSSSFNPCPGQRSASRIRIQIQFLVQGHVQVYSQGWLVHVLEPPSAFSVALN